MKIKIFIASLVLLILISVVYLEKTNSPAVGFPIIADKIDTSAQEPVSTNTNAHIKLPSFSFDKLIFPKDTNNNITFESQRISSLTTKNLVIHFWSSWCNVCGTEWPEMIKFADQNPDTTIVAISIDDNRKKFAEFMTELNNKYHLDQKSNILFAVDDNKLVSVGVFNTEMVPENYFISLEDNQYNIVSKSSGKFSWADLK